MDIEQDRFATDFPLFAPLFQGEPDKNGLRFHFSQWKKFHRDSPQVWIWFQQFAFEAINAGCVRYSADAILHRIRWHVEVETKRDGDYKINNNMSAYYSRLFTHAYPNHAGFFETRKLISGTDEAWLDHELTEIAFQSTKGFHRP